MKTQQVYLEKIDWIYMIIKKLIYQIYANEIEAEWNSF